MSALTLEISHACPELLPASRYSALSTLATSDTVSFVQEKQGPGTACILTAMSSQ